MAKRCRSCCGGVTCQLCTTLTGCGDLSGVAVTVKYQQIVAIPVSAAGSGFTSTPTVLISTTNGSGGAAIALLTATTVNTASGAVTASGGGYTSMPAVTLTLPVGQTGSGATVSASMAVTDGVASAAGTGYVVGDVLTIVGGTSATAAVLNVTAVDGSGGVTAATVGTAGSYTALPASPAAVTGGTGSDATFDLTWKLIALAVTAGGSGYSAPPTVVFSGGGGSGAAGRVSLTATTLASIVVTAGGTYSATPGVTLSGGGGTGATAAATLSGDITVGTCSTVGQVVTATKTASGAGYSSIPAASTGGGGGGGATFSLAMNVQAAVVANGGTGYAVGNSLSVVGGTGAAAVLTVSAVSGGAITAVTIANAGSYTALPTNPASVTGGSGTGATFNLTYSLGTISVVGGGSGYTSNPTVVFSGGSPTTPAAATATVAFKCCLSIPASGRYKVSTSTDVCTPASTPVNVTCPITNVSIAASGTVQIQVVTCGTCAGSVANIVPGTDQWTLAGMGCTRTTSLDGSCLLQFSISRQGTYSLTGSTGPCYQSSTVSVSVDRCSGLLTYTQTPAPRTYTRTVTVQGCGCTNTLLSGASVTISGGGYSQTLTSDASGLAVFTGVPADCAMSFTATYPRFVAMSGTFHSPCADSVQGINFSTPIAGYMCGFDVPYPVPTTLYATDGAGTVTLTPGTVGNIADLVGGLHNANSQTVNCVQSGGTCNAEVVAFGPPIVYKTYTDVPIVYYGLQPCNNVNAAILSVVYSGFTGIPGNASGWISGNYPYGQNTAGSPCAAVGPPGSPLHTFCQGSQAGIGPTVQPNLTPPFTVTFNVTTGPEPGTVTISE
jgi:hypothetical protein